MWGGWHLLQQLYVAGTYAVGLPFGVYLVLAILCAIAQLTAYRVLMVWVYDHTGSLLVATLMHSSLIFTTIFAFTPLATGLSFLAYGWCLTAALWLVVGAIGLASRMREAGVRSQPTVTA
jgi:hypothetical protein